MVPQVKDLRCGRSCGAGGKCSGEGSIPGPGTSTCGGCKKKKKKNARIGGSVMGYDPEYLGKHSFLLF